MLAGFATCSDEVIPVRGWGELGFASFCVFHLFPQRWIIALGSRLPEQAVVTCRAGRNALLIGKATWR